MNYKLIYEKFIADRLNKQPSKPEYFEFHHILPKSLGGSNDPSNIIRLSAEDHFFAHLLLARIYGGKMWAAVHAMCHLVSERKKRLRLFGNRTKFGYIRRALSNYYRSILSGPDGKIADKTEFILYHHDGRVAKGNRFSLSDQTGVTRGQINSVLRGDKKTAHGWYTKTYNPQGLTGLEFLSISLRKKDVFYLFHFSGKEWEGTRADFKEEFGASLDFNRYKSILGWYKSKEDAANHLIILKKNCMNAAMARGDISGHNNPNADKAIHKFKVISTGEVIECTRVYISKRYGISSSHLSRIISGNLRSSRGITLSI